MPNRTDFAHIYRNRGSPKQPLSKGAFSKTQVDRLPTATRTCKGTCLVASALVEILEKVQGANTNRGNRTESLWAGNLPPRGSLRGPLKTSQKSLKTSQKSLKTSESLLKPLKTSQNLSKPLKTSKNLWKNLWKTSLSESLSETLSEADSLSEALGPVAPIVLPLKLSPKIFMLAWKCQSWREILRVFSIFGSVGVGFKVGYRARASEQLPCRSAKWPPVPASVPASNCVTYPGKNYLFKNAWEMLLQGPGRVKNTTMY